MLDRGIKPELEVFDLGMVHFAKVLINEGLIKPPYYFNLLLGNVAGAQVGLSDIAALVSQLPAESYWSLGGIGRFQKPALGLGCIMAPGVRIGLEDNLWSDSDRRVAATNPGMVRWLSQLAQAYGRSFARAQDVRAMLGLT
jgi:uncharacterized protein (DUF849 family)